MIRFLEKKDIPDVLTIYQLGIDTGIATFETRAPSSDQWDQKFHPQLRYVFEENENILGWVSITPVSSRDVYKGVGEVTIYVHPHAQGKGVGSQLLIHLIEHDFDGTTFTIGLTFTRKNMQQIASNVVKSTL